MASTTLCDPCLGQDKSSVAVRYCTDCEEQLCEECFVHHSKFKALKSHHLIELSSVGFKMPITTKKYCDIHTTVLLDFYCNNHEVVCCRSCIPTNHGLCPNVAPLENVSEGIRNSQMLEDSLKNLTHLFEALDRLLDNREDTIKSLKEKETAIMRQISTIKSRFLKQIDDLERDLIFKLQSIKQNSEKIINEQKEELTQIKDHLKEGKTELEFVKEHGSDKQVFLVVRQTMTKIDRAQTDVQTVANSLEDFDIKFEVIPSVNLESFGSITEITRPTDIIYQPLKLKEAQIPLDSSKPINGFKEDGQLKLKSGEVYELRSMVITFDSLLLTNFHSTFPKVYIYRNCKDYTSEILFSSRPFGIAILPGTDKAVVTLPEEKSIQFINSATITKGDKVNLGIDCYGITATKDNIVVGGNAKIHLLDHEGLHKSTIEASSIYILYYNYITGHILCRGYGDMRCVKLDGTQVYQYQVSGTAGVAVDHRGDVYVCGYHSSNVGRYTSEGDFRDTVLSAIDGIKHPYGLLFNNDCTKLFVINNRYTTVKIYSCK